MNIDWRIDPVSVPEDWLKRLEATADACIAAEGLVARLQAFVWLTDDESIRVVNASQRGKDAATDVLSFPADTYPNGTARDYPARIKKLLDPESGCLHLGDVIISVPRAAAQAEEYGHTLMRELSYLLAHGMFHIMGYDHETPRDKQRMREIEERALAAVRLSTEEGQA